MAVSLIEKAYTDQIKKGSALVYLRRLILFVLFFVVLDIGVPFLYLSALNRFNLKNNYNIEYADVLIFGDSHASFGIDPSVFNDNGIPTISYAKGDHYSEFNYYLYKKIVEKYQPPKSIIISTPYFFFNDSREESIFYLLDQAEFSKRYFKNLFSYGRSNFLNYNELFQAFPSFLAKTVLHHPDKLEDYGYAININPRFINTDLITNYHKQEGQKEVHYIEDGYSKKNKKNSRSYYYFKELLKELFEDGVTVFLVETPEYVDTQKMIHGKEFFYQEIEEEIKNYSNIYFIKQSDMVSIDPTDIKLFFDSSSNSHLSFYGSKIYTAELIDIINKNLYYTEFLDLNN